jgi:hypothetical protein
MPLIHIHYPAGTLSKAARDALVGAVVMGIGMALFELTAIQLLDVAIWREIDSDEPQSQEAFIEALFSQKPLGFFAGKSREGCAGKADLHRFARFGCLDDPEHYRQYVQREATRAPVRPALDYGICHFGETKRTEVRYHRISYGIVYPCITVRSF